MSVTPTSFRALFTEFSDVTRYPDVMVQSWIDIAGKLLPECRWGDLLDYGTMLWVAHNLVLQDGARTASAAGGAAGAASGMVSSKSVDKVSVSYDSASVALEGAGAYNLTTYGIRFAQLRDIVGAGGIQL